MTGAKFGLITAGPETLSSATMEVEADAVESRCAEMDECLRLWREEWQKRGLSDIDGGNEATIASILNKIFNIVSDNAGSGVSRLLVARAKTRASIESSTSTTPSAGGETDASTETETEDCLSGSKVAKTAPLYSN